jgi:hypothetical protein
MLFLGGAAEVSDCYPGDTRGELADGLGTIRRSGVQHDLMAVVKKRLRRCAAKPVRAARDENNRHSLLLDIPTGQAAWALRFTCDRRSPATLA